MIRFVMIATRFLSLLTRIVLSCPFFGKARQRLIAMTIASGRAPQFGSTTQVAKAAGNLSC
jgi:hypothetical protein